VTVRQLAADLRAEARRANERRLLVLAGGRKTGFDAAIEALEAADVPDREVTFVTEREGWRFERHDPVHADRLLGTTRGAIVLDGHDQFSPNALGRAVGAVDGGGLFVLLAPPLGEWPDRRDGFDETLAAPPFGTDDVTGLFRERLVGTLHEHPGVAVVELEPEVTVLGDGLTDPAPASDRPRPSPPAGATFPREAYASCLTADQARAVRSFERLRDPGSAVVLEADRGRGKSSAAGLAAACLAAEGRDVLVTAPAFRAAAAGFERARELFAELDPAGDAAPEGEPPRRLEAGDRGSVRFEPPAAAAEAPEDPDVVFVDEAAALPVRVLGEFLRARAVGFCTTVHGYEGAGRGFSVRFRDRLDRSAADVTEATLTEPIRYAAGDPVESWAFRALLLDARPAVGPAVEGATPGATSYRTLRGRELLADEHLLREAFGLLVLAHYRTEPDDLARLLDAPNLSTRALVHDGHVVSVALLAREGGLPAGTREAMYLGDRVRGNMLPDVLTSQLRDPDAGAPVGTRIVRIATHPALRSSGFGSRLLEGVHAELADDRDYFGVGYGATPRLLRFWRANGYRTVHLSTTRNDASGEHSALMIRPESDAGRELEARHAARFRERTRDGLSDVLSDLDPDVVRAAFRACSADATVGLSDHEWRVVAGAAAGPGVYTAAVGAFRRLAVAHLLDAAGDVRPRDDDAGSDRGEGPSEGVLDPREERLLVRKVLQGEPFDRVAEELGYVSTAECMRGLGDAYLPLVDRYGGAVAAEERDRYG